MKQVSNAQSVSQIYINFELISPARAQEYLSKNRANNRGVSTTHVNKLAKEMTDGNWRPTHQGIAFDRNGKLIDGQHRLQAIIKSKKAVFIAVAYNVDPEIFDVIDWSKTRNATDLYAIKGGTHSSIRGLTSIGSAMLRGMTTAKPDKRSVAKFTLDNEELIYELYSIFRKAKEIYCAPLVAAFGNAIRLNVSPEEAILARARRLSDMSFNGTDDPLKHLYRVINRAKNKHGDQAISRVARQEDGGRARRTVRTAKRHVDALTIYAWAVSALRSSLAGRKVKRHIMPAVKDWNQRQKTSPKYKRLKKESS